MKMILLNGHGIDMRVNSAKLHIKNGRTSTTEEPEEFNKWMDNKVTYKGTLHYMKDNAKDNKPFTLNAHVRERVEMWGGC